MSGFSVTFATITPESAEHGDYEETGFAVENVSLREAWDNGPGFVARLTRSGATIATRRVSGHLANYNGGRYECLRASAIAGCPAKGATPEPDRALVSRNGRAASRRRERRSADASIVEPYNCTAVRHLYGFFFYFFFYFGHFRGSATLSSPFIGVCVIYMPSRSPCLHG